MPWLTSLRARSVDLAAFGSDGIGEMLKGRLSPAYGGSDVTAVGPINDRGEILARAIIRRSPRLVRLVAPEVCGAGCIRVASMRMHGWMIGFPRGQCTAEAFDGVIAALTVTDAQGRPVSAPR